MKKIVATQNAPQAIGPYSQAVIAGDYCFCSGQIPLDPNTKTIVGNDIKTQTKQVMTNVQNLLKAAGANMDQVVKSTVYLADMSLFQEFNAVYGEYFPNNPPARSTVAAKGLPMNVLVEVECLAYLK